MDKLVVKGGRPLSGTVEISGAKNSVLPLMTAALMVNGETTLKRVPNLKDTRTMIRLLDIVGAGVSFDAGEMRIDGSTVNNLEAPYDLVKTMRASFYVLAHCWRGLAKLKCLYQEDVPGARDRLIFTLKGLKNLAPKLRLKGVTYWPRQIV